MNEEQLKELMTITIGGERKIPLFVTSLNDSYIIAAYQGTLSKYDILIKYRQKENDRWSLPRTPKHIHWAVDILIKFHSDSNLTKDFLNYLIQLWDKIEPFRSEEDRKERLSINYLLSETQEDYNRYNRLAEHGEYSIKFLILLAKLLMMQEKTNLESAYMFKNLLNSLKEGQDIFKIVSIATHRR